MKKKNLVLTGIGGGVALLAGAFFILSSGQEAAAPMTPAAGPPAQSAATTASVTPQATLPQTTQATGVVPIGTPPAPAPSTSASVVASPLSLVAPVAEPALTQEQRELNAALGQQLTTQFNGRLSFPLTEAKMLAFTQLANKVKKINDRWDVLVASAETDKMAIEYNNLAVSDITLAIKNNKGVTLEEYNELTKFASQDKDFNRLYVAYRDMLAERMKAPVASENTTVPVAPSATAVSPSAPLAPPTIVNGQVAPSGQAAPGGYGQGAPLIQQQPAGMVQPLPNSRQTGTGQPAPVLPPVATTPAINPAAGPADSGSAPMPQGSTTPQYSQQISP